MTTDGLALFDAAASKQAKEDGQDQAESGRGYWFMEVMRSYARQYAHDFGHVTSDHLREYADRMGIQPDDPNWWGTIFRGKEWESIGRVRSTMVSNHARWIEKWAQRGV